MKMSATSTSRDRISVINSGVLPLDDSIKGHKAVLIVNKKPIYGTIQKVESSQCYDKENDLEFGKVFVTICTEKGTNHLFNAVEKLSKDEFRLISDDVYLQWHLAKDLSITNHLKKAKMLDRTIEGSKALVILEGKPIYGTVQKVSKMQPHGKLKDASAHKDVNITLLSEEGGSVSFTAGAKLEKGEFKLISEDVYDKWVYANQKNVINQISRVKREMETKLPEENYPLFKPSSPSVIQLGEQHTPRSPTIEILDGNTKSKIVRQNMEEKLVVEQVVDKSLEGKTALVIIDEMPVFGTISDVDRLGNEIYIQMLTNKEKTVKFEAASKIANDDFRIISGHVYKKWTEASEEVVSRSLEKMLNRRSIKKKSEKLPIFKPRASKKQKVYLRTVSGLSNADLLATYGDGCYNLDINEKVTDMPNWAIGDIVQTKVLSGKYKGSFFVRAEVLNIKGDSIDVRVLLPEKWQVAGTAYRVPKNCIRAIPKDQLQKYVVPLELDVDHSIMFVQCSQSMTIKKLKNTIFKLRGIDQSLMSLLTKSGRHLSDESKIPNDALICQVRQVKHVDSITRRLTKIL